MDADEITPEWWDGWVEAISGIPADAGFDAFETPETEGQ
jgi:hypothetical protein